MRKCCKTFALLLALVLSGGCAADGGADAVPESGQETQSREPESVPELPEETQGTQSAAEETQEVTEPEPLIQTVTVTAVGDCTLGVTQTHGYAGSFHEYYDANGEDYFFDGVRDVFAADDFTLVNLECVLSESDNRVEKEWNLKGRPEYVGIMTGSSVEGCSLGNNHTMDYGQQGLDDTKKVLEDAGVIYALNEHVATYTTASGIVVGIVSSNLLWRDDVHTGYVKDGIEMLRAQGADLVIASCHWGTEGDHYANEYQRTNAHRIIDWGADLVIGTHPHVLQGYEMYNGKMICYSLGNFCFGGNRNPSDKNTAMYQQTFTFVDGVLQNDINASMIPCRISSTSARNDFQPTVAAGEQKSTIIGNLNTYSAESSDICLDEEGKFILDMGN